MMPLRTNNLFSARRVLLPLLLVALVNCVSAALASDLSGSWSGYWANSNNRHSGPLQAQFVKINDTQYRVHFSGRYFRVIPFNYTVVLTATVEGETVTLSGSQHMGRRYGTFCYNATAADCNFTAHYTSKKFRGKFVLRKCCCPETAVAAAAVEPRRL